MSDTQVTVTSNSAERDHISWAQAFIAPFRLVFSPTKLGELVDRVPVSAIFCTLIPDLIIIFSGILCLVLIILADKEQKSFSEVWPEVFQPERFDPGDGIVIFIGPVLASVIGIMALLSLLDVYRDGSVAAALKRCLIGIIMGIPMLIGLTLAVGLVALVVSMFPETHYQDSILAACLAMAFVGSLSIIDSWFWRLFYARVDSARVDSEVRLLCEGCGYDITIADMDSVCPECARPARLSLNPHTPRIGTTWEIRGGIWRWYQTCLAQILRPARCSAQMRLSDGMVAGRKFALLLFMHIAAGAAIWIFLMMRTKPQPGRLRLHLYIMLFYASLVSLVGWFLARGIATIVAMIWFLRGSIRDGRWLAKIARYETAYLWVFCAFNGGLITSFVFAGDWIQHLFRNTLNLRSILFFPPEAIVMLAGNGLLICLWFLRYRAILRAIQWSNY